jgi:hypothetical protein
MVALVYKAVILRVNGLLRLLPIAFMSQVNPTENNEERRIERSNTFSAAVSVWETTPTLYPALTSRAT